MTVVRSRHHRWRHLHRPVAPYLLPRSCRRVWFAITGYYKRDKIEIARVFPWIPSSFSGILRVTTRVLPYTRLMRRTFIDRCDNSLTGTARASITRYVNIVSSTLNDDIITTFGKNSSLMRIVFRWSAATRLQFGRYRRHI